MGSKAATARKAHGWTSRCAVVLSLIAILLLTVPLPPSLCGSQRTEISHSENRCHCCKPVRTLHSSGSTCCYVHSLPGIPAVAMPSPTHVGLALANVSTYAVDPSHVYQAAQSVPPSSPSRFPLLRPILRI